MTKLDHVRRFPRRLNVDSRGGGFARKLPEGGGAAERDVGPADSRDPRLVFLGGPRLPIKSRTLDLRVQTYEGTGGRGGCRYTMLRRRNGKFFGND